MLNLNNFSFHDTGILDVEQSASCITFNLEAVQYRNEEHTFTGFLVLKNASNIIEDGQLVESFRKYYDDGEILTLNIKGSVVEILVMWVLYKEKKELYKKYEINVTDIIWKETGIFEE